MDSDLEAVWMMIPLAGERGGDGNTRSSPIGFLRGKTLNWRGTRGRRGRDPQSQATEMGSASQDSFGGW